MALAYGYLPFFIIPLFASLDRIDQRLLEASRDLGVGSIRTFLHVTLPLSRMGLITAIVITALPMAGDYYTNTHRLGLAEHQHGRATRSSCSCCKGRRRTSAPRLVLLLSLVLHVLHALLPDPDPACEPRGRPMTACRARRRGRERPHPVPAKTGAAVAQPVAAPLRAGDDHLGLHPVVAAAGADRGPVLVQRRPVAQHLAGLLPAVVLLRRGLGRSRTRACCCRCKNSLILGVATVLVATPLGVMLAMGLTRWRSRTSKVANGIALVPLVTPEIVVGSALYLVMINLYQFVPLGRPAMLLGHVTFSVSYVLVIVRSRLLSIGGEYEEAARDLGASSLQAIRTILIPLLMPAIFASAMIVFATSLDDFVVSQFLFGDASNAPCRSSSTTPCARLRRRRSTRWRRSCWSARSSR